MRTPNTSITVCLHNIRSTYNVGAILRTCDGFGAAAIFSGYTPRPHDPALLPHLRAKLDHEIAKTALGAETSVSSDFSDDLISTLRKYHSNGYRIIGLENHLSGRTPISLYDSAKIRALGGKILLVLGEEVSGIPEEIYPEIDEFIEIPMRGQKESFNVSVAAGIALFALNN